MKHTKKKRLLAIVLCMILVLSTGIAAFANENVGLQSVACQAATLERVIKNAEGEDVGTLIADIPEGAFLASSSDANIQMDVQADVGADGVLDRVQQQLETNGEAGYTLNNYVMADVTFYVNGEKQVPQQPITFTVKGTNLDSQKTVAFSDDRQNNPTFPDVTEVTTEDGSKALQFTADMDSETSVFGVTEALQDKEWSAQVGNATVKVTGTEDALPEGAQLTVSEITAENEKEAIENAVMEQENDDSAVTNIVAYDIKFMMNGQEVQPSSPVQVSVDSPQIVSDQDTSVYHVDENNSVEDMDGSVDADGNIVFDAPHFSTYVIVQKGENAVNVTIQHYDATKTTDTKIYADDVRRLPVGGKINDYTKADNWTVDHVVQVIDGTSKTLTNTDKIEVNKECTIKVYYTPKTTTVDGATTFYDYTVKVKDTNYSFNQLTNGTAKNNGKIIAGENKQNYSSYQDSLKVGGKEVNAWTGKGGGVVTELLQGLDANGNVVFNYDEPGFFVNQDKTVQVGNAKRYLRKVYTDYKLTFNQTGDTYTLSSVKDGNGEKQTTSGSDFFPLDNVKVDYEGAYTKKEDSSISGGNKTHNYYFGMRYDVTFKVGDYVGPLNYSFTGDDDLWVVLDGKQVVIDLGGIHDAADKTVNLWDYIKTDEDKQQEHTLTILYMERGAGESNCKMNFTLPSAHISEVGQVPMADLTLKKVNTKAEGLANARFTLENDSTKEKQSAVSGTDGTLSFTKLREGTYTLTETVAPDGYVASATTWKVNVTVNGETATATLYQADGTTAVTPVNGVYNIQNQTQEEHTQMILDYDKTAHVTNWDNRIYDIDITASSKLTSQTTEESGGEADVMLVLDTSGSMKDDGKMTALKNAAKQFVTNTAAKSATSKIGITAFSSSRYNGYYYQGSHGKSTELLTVGDNQTVLTSFIDNLIANGGTDPAVGLDKAYSMLKSAKENGDTLPKYVILFTDGEPTGGGNTWDTTAQTNAEASAQKLKNMGVTVYTIGFGLKDKDKASAFLAGGEYKTWNYYGWTTTTFPGIASSGCAKTADDANSLLDIFNKISETITNNLEIKGAKVVDAIDPKFIILDDNGDQITEEYLTSKNIESVTLANGGKVYYKDGIQYIEWTDQTIPNKNNNAEWHKTITVQAQKDYIGGNNVATNISPDSKITTSYGEGVLPQPRVNVKAKLELNDKNVTIYKGDDVPSAETVLNDMVQNYAKNTGKYGVTTDSFSVNWYTAEALEKKFDASTKIESLEVIGTKVENDTTYYLTVTYDAGAPTNESNANTTLEDGKVKIAGDKITHTVVATSVNDSNRTYGIYNIHVISGTIKITKELVDLSNEDQTFTFVVKKDSEIVATVPLTVRKGEKEASFTGGVLTNLPRGTYTVEEQNTSGYVLNEAKSGTETNCENSVIPTYVARFVLGNSKATENKDSENVIKDYTYDPNDGGTVGQAVFTNEKVITDWDIVKVSASSDTLKLEGAQFTLKDSNGNVRYTGTSNANGKIEWKENGVAVSNLTQGTYEFQETKAPAGYSVSAEKWTILIASNGYLKSIKKADGTEVIAQPTTSEDSVVHYYYEDNALYELPHTGGPGIYLFTIGGILLMGAAAWILYKNKCREVLKR